MLFLWYIMNAAEFVDNWPEIVHISIGLVLAFCKYKKNTHLIIGEDWEVNLLLY